LPTLSSAVHATAVTPIGNVSPEMRSQPTVPTPDPPSLATGAANEAAAPAGLVASAVRLGETAIDGAFRSTLIGPIGPAVAQLALLSQT
jgi:hypothetical protein